MLHMAVINRMEEEDQKQNQSTWLPIRQKWREVVIVLLYQLLLAMFKAFAR